MRYLPAVVRWGFTELQLFKIGEISVKFRGKFLGLAGGNIGKFFSF